MKIVKDIFTCLFTLFFFQYKSNYNCHLITLFYLRSVDFEEQKFDQSGIGISIFLFYVFYLDCIWFIGKFQIVVSAMGLMLVSDTDSTL